ncbi:MAG: MFS transporter, partial [Marivirga sp.]|nr:MFS transporter [Marivirga sp.]
MEKIALTERKYFATFIFVTSLFMLWGIAISMGDVLNRHFQKVLGVSLAESGLVQFS